MKLNAKIISILIISVIVLGFILTKMGIIGAENSDTPEKTPAAFTGPPTPFVKGAIIKPMTVENKIVAKGSILANEEVVLTCEVAGKVNKIYFKEGDRVSEGALLLSLDDSELTAQLAQEKIELEYLTKKEEREAKLLEKGGVSEQQYESTVRDRQTTQAAIELLQVRLSKTKIRAPFAGVVGFRYVSEGSYLSPSARIANLVDTSPVKLEFTIPEKYMSVVKVGTSLRFKVDGRLEDFEGKIYAIEPKIDAETRTIMLRALSPNTDAKLMPGAYADIRIILERIENAVCVPSESVIPEMNAKRVFVMKDGKAQSVEIQTGIRLSSMVQVLEGVQVGDTVLTAGIMQVRNGSKVEITELKETVIEN